MTKQPALSASRINAESLLLASLAVAFTTAVWFMVAGVTRNEHPLAQRVSREKIPKVRIPFIENQGQLATDVRFYANTSSGTVYVTSQGELVYAIQHGDRERGAGWAVKETLAGARPITPRGRGEALNARAGIRGSNHRGTDDASRSKQTVSFGEVYPGIELDLRAHGDNVEKVFVLHPGARPKAIRVEVSGARELKINREGELEIPSDIGPLRLDRPIAYQISDGRREYVNARYSIDKNGYGFVVGPYDRKRTLIIE